MTLSVDVVFVDYKTPALANTLINSFEKHVTKDFRLRYVVVENSDFPLHASLETRAERVVVISNPTSRANSDAHGVGLEASKQHVVSDYVFTSHSDICVTSATFFDELLSCVNDGVNLAGISEDTCPGRISALHSSGLFMNNVLFKTTSLLPEMSRFDVADKLTQRCRDEGLKMRLFANTYNDPDLCDKIDSPFKELGKRCGVDRCVDRNNKVMIMHHGRGTPKHMGTYHNNEKLTTQQWLELCKAYTVHG